MQYFKVSDCITQTRVFLQDVISPNRYTDDQVVAALNSAMFEISRLRPDIFLDMKYQKSIACDGSSYGDMIPQLFDASKVNQTIPLPSLYWPALIWYVSGYLQSYDVEDTQDQRAQTFIGKLASRLMTVAG